MKKRIVVFCAKGFEMMELSPFIDVFGWAVNDYGYEIEVVTCGITKQVTSSFGVTVEMNMTLEELNPEDFDAFAIPGGFEEYGFYTEAYDPLLAADILRFYEAGKPVASVCVGALPLGKIGILKGKPATTYLKGDGRRKRQLEEYGAVVSEDAVVVTDNVITSHDPQSAPYVALTLLEMLEGKERADIVRTAMGF